MKKKKKLTKSQRRRRKIKIFIIEIVVLVVVLLGLLAAIKLGKINRLDLDGEDLAINDLDEDTLNALSGYTTLALFGLDNRSNGDLQTGRSDVIILASINNDTDEVKLVSVYRDTYLNQMSSDGTSYNKANAAYSSGGVKQAIQMLNSNLDLNITDYMTVDFNAVVQCVDALGGVEMEITDQEAVLMMGYIDEVAEMTGKSTTYLPGAGVHTLDGVQAVAYSRIRQTAGDDYKRTERQRAVISAIVDKAKTANIKQINDISNVLFPDIYTSLTYTEMGSLISAVLKYQMGETTGFPAAHTTQVMGSKGDCVIPADLESNVTDLHEFLFGTENYSPSETVCEYSDEISYETGVTAEDAN